MASNNVSANSTFWLVSGVNQVEGSSFDLFKPFAPDSLTTQRVKCGSFDTLIRLTDDLARADSQVEGTIRRVERQWSELSDSADGQKKGDAVLFEPRVRVGQSPAVEVASYLQNFQWNEMAFSQSLSVAQLMNVASQLATTTDDALRTKTAAYNDVKATKLNLAGREGSYLARELVEVIPDTKEISDDFVNTAHICTVVLVLPKGGEADFKTWYEQANSEKKEEKEGAEVSPLCNIKEWISKEGPRVVPRSLKRLSGINDDKDGNSLWRVLVFKSFVNEFKARLRQNKLATARDFEYKQNAMSELQTRRTAANEAEQKEKQMLGQFCSQAWSEVFQAWTHLKAMRVFVEGISLFGSKDRPLKTFLVCVTAAKASAARLTLAGLGNETTQKMSKDLEQDGEECFAYASVSLQPVTTLGVK